MTSSTLAMASSDVQPMELPRGETQADHSEAIEKAAQKLVEVEDNQTVFRLEKSSVYGSAIAFPQIARSSGYKGMFVSLWIRSYMALGLNYFVQMALVMFVGEATQIMNPLGGQMHLCDFGADLDVCKGPDAEFLPRCTGPGGTQFSPSRLYGYTQWAVQKFTKQALLDVMPEQEDVINAKVDPGEYGMENSTCRWLCLLLFVMSVNHEIQICFRMLAMLWKLPSDPAKCHWIESNSSSEKFVFRIAGMPCHWKLITGIIVFIPKLALCYFVLLEGTTLLLDTSGILDTVLGAMSMAFILEVDEMLHDSMITHAGRWILDNMLDFRKEHLADKDEEDGKQYVASAKRYNADEKKDGTTSQGAPLREEPVQERKGHEASYGDLLRQLVPLRLIMTLVVMAIFTERYYRFKCVYKDELGMWVSKDMYTPQRASYGLTDFIFNGFFNTVGHDSNEPFWTMPTPPHLLK
eukprot:s2759_g8.t1